MQICVEQADLDLILNRRIRHRELQLPVRYGALRERKRCPLRVGSCCELIARVPYARFRLEAKQQPTIARGVLWLIEQCERPRATALITVRSVSRLDDVWTIGFAMGDQTANMDRPRMPAARPGFPHGDYVTSASQSLSGTADEVAPGIQASYAAEAALGAKEAKNGLWREERARLLRAVSAIRLEMAKQNIGSEVARRRLKTVEHHLRALHRETA